MLSHRVVLPRPLSLLGALVLVVCLAALLAGPALAAAPTTLSAAANPQVIVYPGGAVVSGTISVPGADLSLLARPAGAADYSPAAFGKAGADGAFSFRVKPSVSTDYRVLFAVTSTQEAAQADVSVQVGPLVTASFPASRWLGGSVTLRGAVAPAHPGGTVVIQRLVAGAWQPLTTVTLGADSRFALSWKPDTFGFYRLRAEMDADADHVAGASASGRVIVNRPNAHHVPLRYAHYIVIVRHEYRLYYYEHGVLVRGFNVALGRPGFRTPLGYFRIGYKIEPAGGALGACAMYYRRRGGIAIHGTNKPWLLSRPMPRDFSHGCARMHNRQALWLYARVPLGTRVHNLR
ncbi:MAG TPA: L,D-transpeptidase [Thermoleophilia bacterium]